MRDFSWAYDKKNWCWCFTLHYIRNDL